MDLLLLLTAPGRLVIADHLQPESVERQKLYAGPMPWWIQSDILFNRNQEFVGVTFFIPPSEVAVALKFRDQCDPKVCAYIPHEAAAKLTRYRNIPKNASIFELRWTQEEPDQKEVTQLMDDWYYTTPSPKTSDLPVAWGYPQIDGFLSRRGLRLPRCDK
jgi:hypothetical protein